MDNLEKVESGLFTYSPLPSSTSFRLLRHLPDGPDGVPQFSMQTFDLSAERKVSYLPPTDAREQRPSYHCLSYTWGNPHAKGRLHTAFEDFAPDYRSDVLATVRCNGRILKIQQNLYDALRAIPTDGWIRRIRNRPHPESKQVLLHKDAALGKVGLVHMYVGQGDDVNARDQHGRTPLHYSALNGHLETTRILLKGGAQSSVEDNEGKTASALALENGDVEMYVLLTTCAQSDDHVQTMVAGVPEFDPYGGDDYIWIDAICIDQSNLEERATQVSLMQDIFRHAAYVYIWLGRADKHTEPALRTASKIANAFEGFCDSTIVPFRDSPLEAYEKASIPYISPAEWDALASLFLRQWFRRIWILQEVVFANSMLFHCGTTTVNWDDMMRVSTFLQHRALSLGHEPSTIFIDTNEIASCIDYYFRVASSLREKRSQLEESDPKDVSSKFSILNLIIYSFPFRATDPRDKIYALLSMATLGPNSEFSMRPDYTIPVQQTYAAFTKLVIKETKNLEILNFVHDMSMKQIEHLPSWTPDYSLGGINPLKSGTVLPFGHLSDSISTATEISWRELGLTGVWFDVISRTSDERPWRGRNQKFELDPSWFQLLLDLGKNTNYQGMKQTSVEALWRTLCTNQSLAGDHPAPAEYGKMFKTFICALICAEPEHLIREEEAKREYAITLASLMVSASKLREERQSGPLDPDEEYMNNHRRRMGSVDRHLRSKFFDCVRPTLSKVQLLASDYPNSSIPRTDEIEEYALQAINPMRDPNGFSEIPPFVRPFALVHSEVYGRRRLFTTAKGFMGLGPVSLDVGDVICLVPGSQIPVVLRPSGPSDTMASQINSHLQPRQTLCTFVGGAYVHGLMGGEVYSQTTEADLKTFILV